MLVDAKHVFCRYAPFVETDSSSAYLFNIGVSISLSRVAYTNIRKGQGGGGGGD